MLLKKGYPHAPDRTVEDVMRAWWHGVIIGLIAGAILGALNLFLWFKVMS